MLQPQVKSSMTAFTGRGAALCIAKEPFPRCIVKSKWDVEYKIHGLPLGVVLPWEGELLAWSRAEEGGEERNFHPGVYLKSCTAIYIT